jgi:hypothetical protein
MKVKVFPIVSYCKSSYLYPKYIVIKNQIPYLKNNKMKKIFIAFVILTSLSITAQESVLLRLNYAKGDSYLLSLESKQSVGVQGGTDMKMAMGMIVSEVSPEDIKLESQITSIAMDVMQGGMSMSYDSSKKAEELDNMGQMMKTQIDPMMKAVIYTTLDRMGNMIDMKVEPVVPGMDQFSGNSNSINYPKEKVSVGSSWTSENEQQGMKMITTYKVLSIADGVVTIDVSGTVSGAGTGSIKGKTMVDVNSGVSTSSLQEVALSAQGMDITIVTKTTMKKI